MDFTDELPLHVVMIPSITIANRSERVFTFYAKPLLDVLLGQNAVDRLSDECVNVVPRCFGIDLTRARRSRQLRSYVRRIGELTSTTFF